MLRCLLTLASAASLLLLIPTVVLWVRSGHHSDVLAFQRLPLSGSVTMDGWISTGAGGAAAYLSQQRVTSQKQVAISLPDFLGTPFKAYHYAAGPAPCPVVNNPAYPGYELGSWHNRDFAGLDGTVHYLVLPFWIYSLGFAMLPSALLLMKVRPRRGIAWRMPLLRLRPSRHP
jgi:hypothetical protein